MHEFGEYRKRAGLLRHDDVLQNCSGIYTLCFLTGKKSGFSGDASPLFPTGNAAEWMGCHRAYMQLQQVVGD